MSVLRLYESLYAVIGRFDELRPIFNKNFLRKNSEVEYECIGKDWKNLFFL